MVVGLEADLRHGPGHLLQILPHPVGQEGLIHHPVGLKIVQGGAVGQNHRGVDSDALGVGGKGRMGPSGGHGEGAAVLHKIADGLHIGGGDPQVGAVQGVVKVADQQHAVKFAQLSSPNS